MKLEVSSKIDDNVKINRENYYKFLESLLFSVKDIFMQNNVPSDLIKLIMAHLAKKGRGRCKDTNFMSCFSKPASWDIQQKTCVLLLGDNNKNGKQYSNKEDL